MDENKMGWREYARFAEMSVEELARDCEVQVFQNRASCLRKLRAELERRGRPPRRRVKTKVPQRSRQRRLNDKHFNAIKKANRRKPCSDE